MAMRWPDKEKGTQGVPSCQPGIIALPILCSSRMYSILVLTTALLLSRSSPGGFIRALSRKGERSLWQTPEASA